MHRFLCWRVRPAYAFVAQLVEHWPEEPGVTGSMPVERTKNGVVAQSGERLHGMQEATGSIPVFSTNHNSRRLARRFPAAVAQLVEHRIENPGVAGSIPAGSTTLWGMKASGLSRRDLTPENVGSNPTAPAYKFRPV